jgi:hypothetical protein
MDDIARELNIAVAEGEQTAAAEEAPEVRRAA